MYSLLGSKFVKIPDFPIVQGYFIVKTTEILFIIAKNQFFVINI